jgi:hypothetical protein
MTQISAHEIELYAVNTGGLYEKHKRLAREGALLDRWNAHVRHDVMARYRREIDRWADAAPAVIEAAATILRDYYREHVAEIARCEIEDGMAAFKGFMRDTHAQRMHVKAYGLANLDGPTRRALAQVVRSEIAAFEGMPAKFTAGDAHDEATMLADELTHARVLLSTLESR